MPRGIYKRTKEMKTGKNPNSGFQINHQFSKGEKNGMFGRIKEKNPMYGKPRPTHKKDCQCSFCKAERGELKGENHPWFGKTNEKSHLWKGNAAGKDSMHKWIVRLKGKASEYECIDCHKRADDWSNTDHSYKRILDDYQARCQSCHYKYDYKLKSTNN